MCLLTVSSYKGRIIYTVNYIYFKNINAKKSSEGKIVLNCLLLLKFMIYCD